MTNLTEKMVTPQKESKRLNEQYDVFQSILTSICDLISTKISLIDMISYLFDYGLLVLMIYIWMPKNLISIMLIVLIIIVLTILLINSRELNAKRLVDVQAPKIETSVKFRIDRNKFLDRFRENKVNNLKISPE